jgi:hypothetical protein
MSGLIWRASGAAAESKHLHAIIDVLSKFWHLGAKSISHMCLVEMSKGFVKTFITLIKTSHLILLKL